MEYKPEGRLNKPTPNVLERRAGCFVMAFVTTMLVLLLLLKLKL